MAYSRIRDRLINVTPQVETCLRESGIQEGLALVCPLHVTAAVFINDDESGLQHEHDQWLEKPAPHSPVNQYQQNRTCWDNADALMKRPVVGRELMVAFTEDRLDFEMREQILIVLALFRFCFGSGKQQDGIWR